MVSVPGPAGLVSVKVAPVSGVKACSVSAGRVSGVGAAVSAGTVSGIGAAVSAGFVSAGFVSAGFVSAGFVAAGFLAAGLDSVFFASVPSR